MLIFITFILIFVLILFYLMRKPKLDIRNYVDIDEIIIKKYDINSELVIYNMNDKWTYYNKMSPIIKSDNFDIDNIKTYLSNYRIDSREKIYNAIYSEYWLRINNINITTNIFYAKNTMKIIEDTCNAVNICICDIGPGYNKIIENNSNMIRCIIPIFNIKYNDSGILLNNIETKWDLISNYGIMFQDNKYELWNYSNNNIYLLIIDVIK